MVTSFICWHINKNLLFFFWQPILNAYPVGVSVCPLCASLERFLHQVHAWKQHIVVLGILDCCDIDLCLSFHASPPSISSSRSLFVVTLGRASHFPSLV